MKKITLIFLFFLILSTSQTFAQQLRTDSNPPATTKVGNPTTSSSSLAAAAIDLGTVIGNACGGSLHKNNLDCLQGLSFQNVPNSAAALALIAQSAKSNLCDDAHPEKGFCLQCVGFVQGAVAGTYGQPLNNGGNASDYATNVPSGYIYIQRSSGTPIEVGDIIVKTGGYGHIAIVTEVSDTQTGISVAEANYDLGGGIVIRGSSLTLWDGWLRKL